LPDVITLSGEDLAVAQRAGLLQPLNDLLPPDLQSDFYPFALAEGRFDDELLAVQFDADIEHTAVNSRRLPAVPRTWDDIEESAASYVFPTGSEGNPGDAFLIQYLGAGGQIGGRNAPFVLDDGALFAVLSFYEQGRRRGLISTSVLGLDTAEATWPQIAAGRADIAHVLASRYLAERAQHPELQFGPVPTQEDTSAVVSRGWTLALVAEDPERQAAASRLMEALLDPELNSRWALASHRLPTRRSALALWDQDDPYVPFLHWHLEAAVAHPAGASYVEAARRLAEAQRAVLSGTESAQEATEQATGMELP
jgi:ABC-type glycerol-3-phosphate transport system substrate-binding protein